ncbi:TRIM3 [Branchiostoma lanceolatum]|uniref:TRIM3 protein n=1 Tax=Branchiostoma lanceolatum TaxID=7740 RepID=A0A8J9YT01_BRALA|nr:TRIM3 [Branchiostoma lanceolatum]
MREDIYKDLECDFLAQVEDALEHTAPKRQQDKQLQAIMTTFERENLTCCIHLGVFEKSPRLLPCLHHLCDDCLTALMRNCITFRCPLCMKKYWVPWQGIKAFKQDPRLLSLRNKLKQAMNSRRTTLRHLLNSAFLPWV